MTIYERILMLIVGITTATMVISIIISLFCHVDKTHIETDEQFYKDNRLLCVTTAVMTACIIVASMSVIAVGFLHIFIK